MAAPDQAQVAAERPGDDEQRERELIALISRGRDVAALERLHSLYRPRLAGFLFRLTHDTELVEEIYNDVMFVVWQKAHQFSGLSKVSTWVFAIAYRKAIKLLQRQQKRRFFESGETENLPDIAAEDSRRDLENRDLITTALRQLPAKQRLVVELSYFADKSYEEIAQIAECPVNTVKTRMFAARRRLNDVVRTLS